MYIYCIPCHTIIQVMSFAYTCTQICLQIFQEENTSIELFADLENSGFLRESHSAFFNAGDPITTLKFYRST